MDGDGFGFGTIAAVAGGFSLLGWLAGNKGGKRRTHERWLAGLESVAKTGTLVESDLDEPAEEKGTRAAMLTALSKLAEEAGCDVKTMAQRILSGAQVGAWMKGRDMDDPKHVGEEVLVRFPA